MKIIVCFSAFTLLLSSFSILSQHIITTFEISPGLRTYYDIQSNGSTHLIEQDPNTQGNLHAGFTVDSSGSSGFPDRKVYYFFSSDFGNTWENYGPNPATGRSGFSTLCITSNGSALMGMNSNFGGGVDRVQWFADVAPGAGSFTRLDPGVTGSGPFLWPVGIPTSYITNSTKFVFAAGTSLNRGLSLSSSNFSGYVIESDIESSFGCAFARSQSGKIALAYIAEETIVPGRVRFKESTDNGVTWSTPVTIWEPAAHNNNGAFRGIDIGYYINTPNIVFETVKYVSGIPDMHLTAKIYFWSPNVNSGNPVVLDTSNEMTGANLNNYSYASVCRPVIGYFVNSGLLLVAYCKARTDTLNTNNYFDVYCRFSVNGGVSWSVLPKRISNNSGPITDNKYVSISDFNFNTDYPSKLNLMYQQDSIPGSFVNGASRHSSKIIYAKVGIITGGGVTPIGNGIPVTYLLKQNFPNPFNPVTFIDFDVPVESNVRLTIYNSIGETVAVLAEQRLQAGSYRADWNAMHYASGVYFYSIQADDYFETKKMVVIK